MASPSLPRRGLRILTPLMAVAVLVAAPGCSTKTGDTNAPGGTSGTAVATSDAKVAGQGQQPQSDSGFTPPDYCGSKDDKGT